MKKATAMIFSLGLLMAPAMVLAQGDSGEIEPISDLGSDDIISILETIRDWFVLFISIVAVLLILYAAFVYVTAGGDDERISKARKILIAGIIGIVIAFLSYSVISIIASFLGAS